MTNVPPCDKVCSTLVGIGDFFNQRYKNISGVYDYVTDAQAIWGDIQGVYQAAIVGSEESPAWVAQGAAFVVTKGSELVHRTNALNFSTKLVIAYVVVMALGIVYKKFFVKEPVSPLAGRRRVPYDPKEAVVKLKKKQSLNQSVIGYYRNWIRTT